MPRCLRLPPQKECSIPGKSCYQVWRTNFEIDTKYQPIKAIGKGAYGVVCSAKNAETGEKVAIKKITNAFENLVDARRTLREMKLLRYLKCVSCGTCWVAVSSSLLRPHAADSSIPEAALQRASIWLPAQSSC